MEDYIVSGKSPLSGKLKVYGAKNAVLPILAGTLLSGETVLLKNCPRLSDVSHTLDILERLGCSVAFDGDEIIVNPAKAESRPVEICGGDMRSSVNFLGALAGRFGRAELPMPGHPAPGQPGGHEHYKADRHNDYQEKKGKEKHLSY